MNVSFRLIIEKKLRQPTRPANDVSEVTQGLQNQHNQWNETTVKREITDNFNLDSNWNIPIGSGNKIFKHIGMD